MGPVLLSSTFCYFLGSFRTSRDTWACDLSQCRQITPGCLEKGKRPGDREAKKISARKQKEWQKVSLCKVSEMCEYSHADHFGDSSIPCS